MTQAGILFPYIFKHPVILILIQVASKRGKDLLTNVVCFFRKAGDCVTISLMEYTN
jgi:hypothetical protein